MAAYKIDISPSVATSNLTNYPARVSTLSVGGAVNTSIFAADSGGGADVWFSSDAAGASPIDAKLIYWSDADSVFAFDVEVASISSTTGATIYMQVGSKPGGYGTDPYPSSTDILFPLMGDLVNKTSYDRSGIVLGGVSAGGATGPDGILPATDFDGVDDQIQIPTAAAVFNGTNTPFSISSWVNPDAAIDGQELFRGFGGTGRMDCNPNDLSTGGTETFRNAAAVRESGGDRTSAGWYQFVWTFDGTDGRIYVNGVLLATANQQTTALSMTSTSIGGASTKYDGQASDLKTSSAVFSLAEINADYLLQGPNAATYMTAAEVGGGSATLQHGKLSGIIGQPLRGLL